MFVLVRARAARRPHRSGAGGTRQPRRGERLSVDRRAIVGRQHYRCNRAAIGTGRLIRPARPALDDRGAGVRPCPGDDGPGDRLPGDRPPQALPPMEALQPTGLVLMMGAGAALLVQWGLIPLLNLQPRAMMLVGPGDRCGRVRADRAGDLALRHRDGLCAGQRRVRLRASRLHRRARAWPSDPMRKGRSRAR